MMRSTNISLGWTRKSSRHVSDEIMISWLTWTVWNSLLITLKRTLGRKLTMLSWTMFKSSWGIVVHTLIWKISIIKLFLQSRSLKSRCMRVRVGLSKWGRLFIDLMRCCWPKRKRLVLKSSNTWYKLNLLRLQCFRSPKRIILKWFLQAKGKSMS